MAEENLSQPKRELTLAQVFAIIIGTVIGSGVFISIPIVAAKTGSPLFSTIIWFVSGVIWIPQILVIAEMGSAYPSQGFGYYYLNKAGSPFLGFLYTWTAFLTSDTPTLTIVGLSAASVLAFFFPMLNEHIYAAVFTAFLILSLMFVQIRSVKTGGNFQILLTIGKMLPLIAVVLFGFIYFDESRTFSAENVSGENISFFVLITTGISATAWSYAGFGNVLYMAGEVKDPEKNLPIALLGSLFFVMTIYSLISLAINSLVPFHEIVKAEGSFVNPFSFISLFGSGAGAIFSIAAFISMIGVINAGIMAQPRLEYAMAKDGLFFKPFARLHPKYGTPHYSITIQCSLAVILLFLGNIEELLGYFTLSYVLQNGLVYSAIFFLKKREDYNPRFKSPFWKLMASLAVISQVYIAGGVFVTYPTAGLFSAAFLILTGAPVYLYFYKKKNFSYGKT